MWPWLVIVVEYIVPTISTRKTRIVLWLVCMYSSDFKSIQLYANFRWFQTKLKFWKINISFLRKFKERFFEMGKFPHIYNTHVYKATFGNFPEYFLKVSKKFKFNLLYILDCRGCWHYCWWIVMNSCLICWIYCGYKSGDANECEGTFRWS